MIDQTHTRLGELLAEIVTEDDAGEREEQRDVSILNSLPGIGRIVLATLLAEATQALGERDYHTLRMLTGVAPVTWLSGKSCVVKMRQACNKRLRNAMYHWALVAIQHDTVSRERYYELRGRGHSHARALRSVSDRLLKVACVMLRNRTRYDPETPGGPRDGCLIARYVAGRKRGALAGRLGRVTRKLAHGGISLLLGACEAHGVIYVINVSIDHGHALHTRRT